ncbi:hypothetical protein HMPREF0322_02599 [Desulfitobacterium hafniense DP7]|uniref:Uncharacterized protein n=1 Tax=Desulfitobacterium hafniense DP7 TaxID=537010 RepID=G9XNQ6_DESHA|nr:hypothetical protein HMPREF0322_02599 [Desulfitobacterium hafniense DP7]
MCYNVKRDIQRRRPWISLLDQGYRINCGQKKCPAFTGGGCFFLWAVFSIAVKTGGD